jgi:hypothetical protein
MEKPSFCYLGARNPAIYLVFALAVACTGTVGGVVGDPGSAGSGTPPGQGAGGSLGGGGATSAGSAGTGTSSPGTGGAGVTGAGGVGAPGGTTGAGGVRPVVSNPPAFQAAPGMLRRLTRIQFRNAVRDVFGVEVNTQNLDADSWNDHFATIGASTVVTSETGVEQYGEAIEAAVNAVFADATKRAQFIGCTPTGQANDTCVRGYIQRLGLRAWRRPLTTAELDRFVALAAKAATDLGGAVEGARWATVALFTSPSFLYRPEFGATVNGSLRYTGYEMASRLAFLIWSSLPDQTLMDQAAGGMLGTAAGIRTAATRLLDAPAGRESVGAFAEEFMRVDRIATQAKDAGLYPEYTPALQAGMARDIKGTFEALAFDDKVSALDVFTTTKVVVNADLARLYGLDATGLTSTTFQVRSLPADGPRAGALTKAGFLSQFANQKEGSPTLRGKFIREALLCLAVPPPPGDVNTSLPDPPPNMPLTKRQRLELHRVNDACKACHGLMDPMGLPLENFDGVGKYRTTDHGLPIDASGALDGQNVTDARGLGVAASTSTTVAHCFVRRFYTYAVGHAERPVDGSVLNSLAASFQANGYKMRELILDVVTSDAFSSVAPQP